MKNEMTNYASGPGWTTERIKEIEAHEDRTKISRIEEWYSKIQELYQQRKSLDIELIKNSSENSNKIFEQIKEIDKNINSIDSLINRERRHEE